MRLAQKIGKLQNGAALESARRHANRLMLTRRVDTDLEPKNLIQSIDAEQFEAIGRRYPGSEARDAWPKYFNLPKWMAENLRRIRQLGLDRGFRKTILDLGCGAGYFLFIAKILGHDTLGLDIDDVPMFGEMMMLLGLSRVIWRIQPFVRLPNFRKKFDLITAFMVCFNGHKTPGLWGVEEWRFFLDDLETWLNPHGRICLGFNREADGSLYSEELQRFFLERGAEINGKRMILALRQ